MERAIGRDRACGLETSRRDGLVDCEIEVVGGAIEQEISHSLHEGPTRNFGAIGQRAKAVRGAAVARPLANDRPELGPELPQALFDCGRQLNRDLEAPRRSRPAVAVRVAGARRASHARPGYEHEENSALGYPASRRGNGVA